MSGGHVVSVVRQKKHGRRFDAVRNDDFIEVQNIVDIDAKNGSESFPRTGSTMWLVRDLTWSRRIPLLRIRPRGPWLTATYPGTSFLCSWPQCSFVKNSIGFYVWSYSSERLISIYTSNRLAEGSHQPADVQHGQKYADRDIFPLRLRKKVVIDDTVQVTHPDV